MVVHDLGDTAKRMFFIGTIQALKGFNLIN